MLIEYVDIQTNVEKIKQSYNYLQPGPQLVPFMPYWNTNLK